VRNVIIPFYMLKGGVGVGSELRGSPLKGMLTFSALSSLLIPRLFLTFLNANIGVAACFLNMRL
jgi:hypothetical protein